MRKVFGALAIMLAIGDFAFSIENIFFKAGAGIGYDSNLLFSLPPYDTGVYLARFGGYGKWGRDTVQFILHGNTEAEIYDTYYHINADFAGGIILFLLEDSYIKAEMGFLYLMDINHSLFGNIEYRQDIGEYFTFKSFYEIENSTGAMGVINETFLLNSFSLGVNFDLCPSIEMELNLKDTFISYSQIFVEGEKLNNNGISALAAMSFRPQYDYTFEVGGGYSYYYTFNTNLFIFSDTNSIHLYNSANQYKFMASLNYEWSPNFKTIFSTEASWTKLIFHPVTEEVYNLNIEANYYFNSSWKLEVPFFYTLKNTTLSASFDRWRISGIIYYLF